MSHEIRCDVCGKFVSYADLESGAAFHRFVLPDSEFTSETFETLCKKHNEKPEQKQR